MLPQLPNLRNDQNVRVLPHNTEAEQSLLGALLLSNESYENVAEFLLPQHFFSPIHGKIYEAISKMIARGLVADPITLKAYFEKSDELAGVGGGEYLVQLVSSVVFIAAVGDHAKLIYDLYARRQLILIGENLSYGALTFELNTSTSDQIEKAESKLYELSLSGKRGGFIPFSTALSRTLAIIETAYRSDSSIVGITSGFADLDKTLGGLNRSDLIILAGRPSMGKTALATNIAFNAALSHKKNSEGGGKVAFYSLEMSSEQLLTRIISQQCNTPSEKIRKGEIKEEEYVRVIEAMKEFKDLPFSIDDTPALSVSMLRARARQMQRKHGLDLIVIDYLQLLQGSEEKKYNDNRVQEISEITRSLKALAKELNVPVIALSQLSRAVEMREDKRPQLADLRESGSIEQDADIVMFVYREEYYEARREPTQGTEEHMKWESRMDRVRSLAEVIIAKQRHGPIGTVRLFFDGRYTKFDNLAEDRKINYE